ncbi:hypothetical protein KY284_028170 [Solanum tuberosum]|nr:hypothetical protein KY284_028170 [Solanum tuberosum]
MIKGREEVEPEIWWSIKQEFEYDQTVILVKEVAEEGHWDEQTLKELLPQDLADHILQRISPPKDTEEFDRPYWKLESRGKFTVSIAFQKVRQKQEINKVYNLMWIKGMPIKIYFFMWKLWKSKLPLDDTLKKWGIQFPSRCYCCENSKVEDTSHVFLHSPIAQMVWKQFCEPVGINMKNMQLSQIINRWWEIDAHHQIKYIFQVVPSIIVWELWKRRNTLKNGKKISSNKVIYQIMHTLILFMKTRRRNCTYIPYKWTMVVEAIHNYNPTVKVTRVIWGPPDTSWVKVNTDGASKGNPGRSSWGFCVRNNKGDVIQAQAKEIDEPLITNTQAETMALLHALKYIETAQLDKVIIEIDSLLLKNIVERVWKVPWKVVNILEEI